MVHQLELITDYLGTPSAEVVAKVGLVHVCLVCVCLARVCLARVLVCVCVMALMCIVCVFSSPTPNPPQPPLPLQNQIIEIKTKVRNEKARRFLAGMRRKPGISFEALFPKAEPKARALLRRLLAFDPADRPSAGEEGWMAFWAGGAWFITMTALGCLWWRQMT